MARRRGERTPLNAEINVVSLIDVMMLLLVIFMITAPMMQGGVDVQLPKGEARALEPEERTRGHDRPERERLRRQNEDDVRGIQRGLHRAVGTARGSAASTCGPTPPCRTAWSPVSSA